MERKSMIKVRGGFSDRAGIDPCNIQMQIDDFDERTRTFISNKPETAADYYHSRTPSVAREVIRASQISGIEDNSVLAQFTGHLHADVNLYPV